MDIEFYRHHFNALEAAREPPWRYEENKPCGCNFDNFFLARVYDTYHQMFPDYRREAEQIVAALALDRSATVLDMGCGTGAFVIHAAPHYRKVYAVDVAKAMLGRARRKARKTGLTNIEFHRGGFLSYEHAAAPVDGIVCVVALHHLPDFWKLVGLHRLASLLKPGGRLYLCTKSPARPLAATKPVLSPRRKERQEDRMAVLFAFAILASLRET